MDRVRVPLASSVVRWSLVAVVAGTILAASVVRPTGAPAGPGPFGVFGMDKYLHFLAYAGLATALVYALVGTNTDRVAVVVFVAAVGFGLFVELLQLPLGYRTFSLADAAANAVGATVVTAGWRLARTRVRFRPVAVD